MRPQSQTHFHPTCPRCSTTVNPPNLCLAMLSALRITVFYSPMAVPARFELATNCLEGNRSFPLSYGTVEGWSLGSDLHRRSSGYEPEALTAKLPSSDWRSRKDLNL